MTLQDRIHDEYFEWLCEAVDIKRFDKQVSYRKLLVRLLDIEFTWFVPYDDNRADDGIKLRRHFALERDDISITKYLSGPCSVLEMMVALAIRCEKTIMDNAQYGNRTGQWFWGMIHNLGLSPMIDSDFDRNYVDEVITRFLNRDYEPNGKGGLFTIRHCNCDLRTVEIWRQLNWYLGSIM